MYIYQRCKISRIKQRLFSYGCYIIILDERPPLSLSLIKALKNSNRFLNHYSLLSPSIMTRSLKPQQRESTNR